MEYWKPGLFTLAGALVGFAYHRFVGCRSGTCAIWASPYASLLYGALVGFVLGRGAG